jgi:predicted small lipoprotein YifL
MIRPSFRPAIALAIALACSGCGLKGPLFLPDQVSNVEVRPAASPPPPSGGAPPATAGGIGEPADEEPADEERSKAERPQD